jgi:hypothetical protein
VFYAELKHESIYKSRGGSRVIYWSMPEVNASEWTDSETLMANLLTIMSRFDSLMDEQQEQLSSIQVALMSPTLESGAIPKQREVGSSTQSQDSNIPSLQNLRADTVAAAQAASMVEALDLGGTGNSQTFVSSNSTKATKTSLGRAGSLVCYMMNLTF